MKTSRVITLVLVAVTTLLCCLPASALDVANSYSYSNVIDNSLTQYLNVSVMYADDESYAYVTDSDVVQYYDAPSYQALVNYRVKNTSDQDANLNVSYIALDFGLQASGYNVIGVEYVSGALEPYYVSISDFRLQQVDGTSTTVIVPAGGYISGTFIIHLQETYDNSSGTHTQYPAFSNFNTWDSFSPTYGDYNSSVIDYVSDIYVELLDDGVSLDNILSILSNYIPDTYSSYSSPSGPVRSANSYLFNLVTNGTTVGKVATYSRVFYPYVVSSDNDVLNVVGQNIDLLEYVIVDVPVLYTYRLTNITSRSFKYHPTYVDFKRTSVELSGGHYMSSDFESLEGQGMYISGVTSDHYTLFFNNVVDGLPFIGSNGIYYYNILEHNYYAISRIQYDSASDTVNNQVTINTVHFPSDNININQSYFHSYTSSNIIGNLFIGISNLIDQLQSIIDSYTSNQPAADEVSDQSDDLATETQNQHQQEQTYYSDTNTALENSGLPDYSFNSQQTGGLSGVSDDFVRVWNACGALNSVFVFSLTLSLALFILRHRRRL